MKKIVAHLREHFKEVSVNLSRNARESFAIFLTLAFLLATQTLNQFRSVYFLFVDRDWPMIAVIFMGTVCMILGMEKLLRIIGAVISWLWKITFNRKKKRMRHPNESDVIEALVGLSKITTGEWKIEPLAQAYINGISINTVLTPDFGPETAIIDAAGVYPVERYKTKEDALAGHARWCGLFTTENVQVITMIGTPPDIMPSREITLNRAAP